MIYWSDSELRQGRDDPRPVDYHHGGWFCVGVALCALSAIIVLLIGTYLAMNFPRLWQ